MVRANIKINPPSNGHAIDVTHIFASAPRAIRDATKLGTIIKKLLTLTLDKSSRIDSYQDDSER